MIILETKRLILRELEQNDFNETCKLLQDPIVMYAYEGPFNKKEVQEWLDKQFKRYQNEGVGLWGVIEKCNNELIGQCGIYSEKNFGIGVTQLKLRQLVVITPSII